MANSSLWQVTFPVTALPSGGGFLSQLTFYLQILVTHISVVILHSWNELFGFFFYTPTVKNAHSGMTRVLFWKIREAVDGKDTLGSWVRVEPLQDLKHGDSDCCLSLPQNAHSWVEATRPSSWLSTSDCAIRDKVDLKSGSLNSHIQTQLFIFK